MQFDTVDDLRAAYGPFEALSFATEWTGGATGASGVLMLMEDGRLIFDGEIPARAIFGLPMGDSKPRPKQILIEAPFTVAKLSRKQVIGYQKRGDEAALRPKAIKKPAFFDRELIGIVQKNPETCYYFDILSPQFCELLLTRCGA